MMQIDEKLSAMNETQYLRYLFKHTDADGKVYIPGRYYNPFDEIIDADSTSYCCEAEWDEDDCKALIKEVSDVKEALYRIAVVKEELTKNEAENRRLLGKDFDIWQRYVEDYIPEKFDMDKVYDIYERDEILAQCKEVARKYQQGDACEWDLSVLKEGLDITVTDDEERLLDAYFDQISQNARRRQHDNIGAHRILFRARRICRLFELGAPEVIITDECKAFAVAMLVNRFGIGMEEIENDVRKEKEQHRVRRVMSDEWNEWDDEAFRPKCTNGRKSMAAVFVYLILHNHSDKAHPLKQQAILRLLAGYPYEVTMERKALGRIIHGLEDSQIGIHSDRSKGAWYDEEE